MEVLSIEQMNKLKELGVDTSKASVRVGTMYFKYRAFTLQDVIELLPKSIIINSVKHWFCVSQNCLLTEFQVMYFNGYDSYGVIKQNKSLLQAAYNMLIWVIENGYLKTK